MQLQTPTMRNLFTLLLILTSHIFCLAQDAIVSGKVIDEKTKLGLDNIAVQIGTTGSMTDAEGKFSFKTNLGTAEMKVSSVGYESIFKRVQIGVSGLSNLVFEMIENRKLLETTTITAGKYEAPLQESTVSLEVIKPRLIENNNLTTVDQVLNKVPSVNIIDGQANIRGGSGFSNGAGSRVLVLMDDLPILQSDAGLSNWNDLPIENISQIEVLKGAASALYGSAAMNGIINLRTSYATSQPVTKVAVFTTAYLEPENPDQKWWSSPPLKYGTSILHKRKIGKTDLVLGGFLTNGDNYNYIDSVFNKYGRFNVGIRHRLNDRLVLGLNTNFNKGLSRSFFLWRNDKAGALQGDNGTIAESDKVRYNIDPYVNYRDKWNSQHKILGRWFSINNDNSAEQSNKSEYFYGEYQWQHNFTKLGLIATAGLVSTYTSVNADLYGDTTYSITNRAAYTQLDKKLWNWLTLSVGARYEYNAIKSPEIIGSKFGLDTIPNGVSEESKPVFRAGLNAKLAKGTFLRASYGQAYRFPTIAEKFITTRFSIFPVIPNAKLESETGWTSEIGLKQGFRIMDWQGFVDVAGFWTEYNNMMEFTLTSLGFQSQNIGNTVIKGIDFSVVAEGKIGNVETWLLTGYTYIDPKFKNFTDIEKNNSSSDENVLKYRFKHTVKWDIEGKYNSISLGFSYLYNSNMDAIDKIFEQFIPGVKTFRDANNKGFSILDIRTSVQISRQIKTSLIMGNVLNTAYSWRPARQEAPRSISLRIDYSI